MKSTNKILLVLMALACLVLVSCPQPEQPETWKEITTFKGLDGTWVGVSNVDLEEDVEDLEEIFGDGATATQSFSLTIKGDSYMVTESLSIDMTTVLENALKDNPDAVGATTDDLWKGMQEYWETELEELDYEISFSSGRPYIMIFTDEPYPVSEENLFYEDEYDSSKWCVNNTKTKLKNINCYPAYDEETGEPLVDENGILVKKIEEMIFVKK
jgi:uncharacterized lipoprotein YehR (DUF1307 family)